VCITSFKLQSKSRMYHGQTGATLDDSMIETFVHLNEATRVPFTADELTAIKQSRGTGVELLYFTNQSELTPDLNISTPYFMFPDEKRLQGSTALFAALVEDMVQKDLIAVVRFVRSKAAMPRLAAMIPQMEYLNKDGIQMLPLGMHLVQLPFSEEISLKHHEGPLRAKFDCKEAADAAAVAVVKALTIDTLPYNLKGNSYGVDEGENEEKKMCYFRDIGNPGLQRFYSVLQAIALMEDLPSDQAQREQDLLKPYFLLEPSHKEGEEEQKESFDAVVRKRAILNFKQAVGLDDDAVAVSECPKVRSHTYTPRTYISKLSKYLLCSLVQIT
jgi:Ku70/Ku80 beta-barrel domain/Ku70/Ku80 C-terminal arm